MLLLDSSSRIDWLKFADSPFFVSTIKRSFMASSADADSEVSPESFSCFIFSAMSRLAVAGSSFPPPLALILIRVTFFGDVSVALSSSVVVLLRDRLLERGDEEDSGFDSRARLLERVREEEDSRSESRARLFDGARDEEDSGSESRARLLECDREEDEGSNSESRERLFDRDLVEELRSTDGSFE
mmetsp:Transcript_3203/g.6111  ORF Transcript_3203/g.6111 Transcript_3203/m.6111 type:complete len:186 (-) Transcript_3203:1107-1664(-)